MRRTFAFDRLRLVRDEFEAARFAVAETSRSFEADPAIFKGGSAVGVDVGALRRCAQHLERTYILRLFAEFEGVLSDYWRHGLGRRTRPAVSVVMTRLADIRSIPPAHDRAAADIREFRNAIIHEGEEDLRYRFDDCRSGLARFMSHLPVVWGPH